jgi:hypothetical protein
MERYPGRGITEDHAPARRNRSRSRSRSRNRQRTCSRSRSRSRSAANALSTLTATTHGDPLDPYRGATAVGPARAKEWEAFRLGEACSPFTRVPNALFLKVANDFLVDLDANHLAQSAQVCFSALKSYTIKRWFTLKETLAFHSGTMRHDAGEKVGPPGEQQEQQEQKSSKQRQVDQEHRFLFGVVCNVSVYGNEDTGLLLTLPQSIRRIYWRSNHSGFPLSHLSALPMSLTSLLCDTWVSGHSVELVAETDSIESVRSWQLPPGLVELHLPASF